MDEQLEKNNQEKQKIRDKIERLKHLKEPYLKVVEICIPVFVAVLILLLGTATNSFGNVVEVNQYAITLQENQTQNISGVFYGNIQPIKSLNSNNLNFGFQNILIALLLIYLVMGFFMVFISKYAKYDEQIKILYNELLGIKNSKLDNVSKLRKFFFSLKTKLFKFRFSRKNKTK